MMPRDLPAPFLEDITGRFSVENRVGRGGYGEVFKGVLTNGTEIAVKKLYDVQELDDEQFKNEFSNLMRVQHKNIIRFIGYCNEIRFTPFMLNEEHILVRRIYKALCFEYLPHGSLDNHLYEESYGLDWCTRYKIIKGICEGLNYLHNGLEEPIFHLDLKPANILLDKNMMPKIADFGVSRPFGGTHTRTTKVCVGSEYYMPPEYMSKRQISNKNDIFSLGIIIIQTMTGRRGYTKYGEIESPQQFVELVISNWRHRIGATSNYLEEECQQVKRCIEIAVSCIDLYRHKRPAISDILLELKETETYSTAWSSSQDLARVAKIGQWGGAGGSNHCDLEVAPHSLESLTIFSGEVIYALEFSYSDHRGLQYTAGPWGGNGPNNKGSHRNEIQLGLSEYITEIYGTVGPFDMAPAGVVTSLSFITNNARHYGPFGDVRGSHFRIPVQGNGSIVGFFVRAGWYLDAFGVYVNPKQQPETLGNEEENKVPLAKIGPWGGNGGCPCDIMVSPHRLVSVTIIHSDTVVSSLEFSYMDPDGVKHTIGPWGSSQYRGESETIELGISEFVRALYGTTGPAFPDQTAPGGAAAAEDDVVTSLTLVTNTRRCGPFGRQAARGGTISFHIPMRGDGSIVGFFGRADSSFIHAIGVYADPYKQEGTTGNVAADELGKSGPWGGSGGQAYHIDDDKVGRRPEPHHLVSVTIRCGAVIDSIEFSYMDSDGNEHTVGPWGGPGGKPYTIRLGPLESLQGISGTFGPFDAAADADASPSDNVVITSLTFATNQCLGYGPFGQGGGTPFTAPDESDGNIVGFFGRAGSYLHALGVYNRTAHDLHLTLY